MLSRLKKLRWPAALIAALVIGAGVAYASIPGPDGVIHGCYKTTSPGQGALIAIDSAANCPAGTAALNWNQTGPQGATGATGSAGTNGVSGYEVITARDDRSSVTVGQTLQAIAHCSIGKVTIGGGVDSPFPISTTTPAQSDGVGFDEWEGVSTADHNTGPVVMIVYAICAAVT